VTSSERDAFEAVFRAHYDGLVRFANRLVRSHAEAEELVHDVLLKVWMRRAHLAPTEELKTYLFRSTYNHALNHLRRRKVERLWKRSLPPDEPIAPPTSSDDDIHKMETAVRRAVDDLPPRCKEIFLLSREDGLTYSGIASTLGVSIKTVETQMGRALKALRAALEPLRR
jgi:RNA polymerase sigma-70 factor (ECF subfamily)